MAWHVHLDGRKVSAVNIINAEETNAYDSEKSPSKCVRCPRLVMAGLTLFACNILVLGGMALSPELKVGVYGEESGRVYAADKPSPFMEVVDSRPHKVRLAERVKPIVVQEGPTEQYNAYSAAYTPTELNLPRASQVSVPVRRASEVTAPDSSLQIRRISENARPYESPKVAPSHSF